MRGYRILVLDADLVPALAVTRSLVAEHYQVVVASSAPRPISAYSKGVLAHLVYPDPLQQGTAFIEWLERETVRHRYDLVIPVSERTLVPLVRSQHRVKTRIASADVEALEAVLDKRRTFAIARSLGIPVPGSFHVEALDQLEPMLDGLTYPVVVKPARSLSLGIGGGSRRNVAYAHGAAQLRRLCASCLMHSPVIVQSFFQGQGVGVEVIARHGEILFAFQHRRLHEMPLTGGGSSFRVSVTLEPVLVQAARKLMAALAWHGVAMVEFKWCPQSGDYCLMEINGRFWGSLPLAIAAGANFPAMLARLELTGDPGPIPGYREGVYCRNLAADTLWHEMVARAWIEGSENPVPPSVGSVFRDLLFTFSPRHHLDVQRLSDPLPGLVDMLRILRRYRERMAGRISERLFFINQRLAWRRGEVRERIRRANRILFICYGNINRSILAETLMTRLTGTAEPGWISSAGFHSRAQRPADPQMVELAGQRGIDLSGARSRSLDPALVERADIIYVMEKAHYDRLAASFPQARQKAFLLGAALARGGPEIADPHNRAIQAYRHCYEQIESAVMTIGRMRGGPDAGN